MGLDKTRQAIEREHTRIANLSAWYVRHPRVPGPYHHDPLARRLAIIERQLAHLDHAEAAGFADRAAVEG